MARHTASIAGSLVASAVLAASLSAESVPDSPGVTVLLNGSTLLHRTAVHYPAAAREKGIQGAVTVELTLDGRGEVSDAHVVSGIPELRRAALESVLQWHFTADAANSTRQVAIQFMAGESKAKPLVRDFIPSVVVLQQGPAGPLGSRIHNIEVNGLPADATNELLARLPVRAGDVLSMEAAEAVGETVKEFDEHLKIGFIRAPNQEASIVIQLPNPTR
ncbi:MAG: energy transducer TonB [Acidobacteriia bacterium]|nr:energy transducer TonB [Terriglobia bacterium]MBV8905538.1 energy transducer TonB [Terriglobia bacterium]